MVEQTQLALVGGVSTTPNAFAPFSRAATAALTRTGTAHATKVEAILHNPVVHAEIKRLAPDLVAASLPAGGDFVRLVLLERIAPVCGVPWEDDSVGDVALREYETALGDLPVEALHRGIDAFHKSPESRFFPRPGPLREFCLPHAHRLFAASFLARTVAARDAKVVAPRTPEQRAAEREALIAAGHMNPDGSMNLTTRKGPPPAPSTGETRAEMAERTRRLAAELEARKPLPPSDEVIV